MMLSALYTRWKISICCPSKLHAGSELCVKMLFTSKSISNHLVLHLKGLWLHHLGQPLLHPVPRHQPRQGCGWECKPRMKCCPSDYCCKKQRFTARTFYRGFCSRHCLLSVWILNASLFLRVCVTIQLLYVYIYTYILFYHTCTRCILSWCSL